MFCPCLPMFSACSFHGNSINSLLSYCGLVDITHKCFWKRFTCIKSIYSHKLVRTAKRKLERRQFSTSSSFVKIWSACSCEFKAYFWTFWALYHLLFDLESIGVNYIIIWRKRSQWYHGRTSLLKCLIWGTILSLPSSIMSNLYLKFLSWGTTKCFSGPSL